MALRLRIRHKLVLGLGLVIGLMALLLGGTLKGLLSYRAAMKAIESKMEEAKKANLLRDDIQALAIPGPSTAELADLIQRIREAKQKRLAYQTQLQETLDRGRAPNNAVGERDQVKGLEEQFARLDVAVAATQDGSVRIGEGSRSLVKEPGVEKAIKDLRESADDLVSVIYRNVGDRVSRAQKDFQACMWFVLSASGIGVVLLCWLLRFFYGWVFYPVRDLQEGAGRVAQGDFAQRIEVHSGDEMEDLAAAFNDMMGRLQETYTDMARQINERSRQLVRSERLAGVGFLAAGVAHEINNPLASIAFCSEALEARLADVLGAGAVPARAGLAPRLERPAIADPDRETITKYLKMIQQEAFRCKEITQRLLEFSRGGERRREPADLGEVVQGVLEVAQHLQNSKGKKLLFQPAGRLVAWVNAQEIKSVVLNLVANALDSMEEGGTLTVTQRQKDGMAELSFADTGCGMTAEVLENIFEPFFTRSRTGKGTGLGLSISHRIINQHGGEIEAASPGPGQGSTFTVRLPLKPAQGPKADTREARPEVADPELYFQDQRSSERRDPDRKAA